MVRQQLLCVDSNDAPAWHGRPGVVSYDMLTLCHILQTVTGLCWITLSRPAAIRRISEQDKAAGWVNTLYRCQDYHRACDL
jgi:hypothetical protein